MTTLVGIMIFASILPVIVKDIPTNTPKLNGVVSVGQEPSPTTSLITKAGKDGIASAIGSICVSAWGTDNFVAGAFIKAFQPE